MEPLREERSAGVTPTAALICESLNLKIMRMQHARKRDPDGSAWCRKRGVGYRRELLGYAGPANVVPLRDTPAEIALTDARCFLVSHCTVCGLCSLAKA